MAAELSKAELLRQVKKLLLDKERGISVALFAELCGVGVTTLWQTFVLENAPMSEVTQRRVNKGYAAWKSGAVKIMKRPDNTRYVDFRKVATPAILPSMGIQRTAEGFKLRVGPVNRHDYSQPDLDEPTRG